MSLEEFKSYVRNSGVDFDALTTNEKRKWRESFDKSRQAGGKSLIFYLFSSWLSSVVFL